MTKKLVDIYRTTRSYYSYFSDDRPFTDLQKDVEAIEKTYNGTVYVNLSEDYEGDLELVLICKREETDEEYEGRIKKEEHQARLRDAIEREQYLRLKTKFEGK